MKKRTFRKFSKRRRRLVLLVLTWLAVLFIGGLVLFGVNAVLQLIGDGEEQAVEVPEDTSEEEPVEEQAPEEETVEEEKEEPAPVPPQDPTMYLSVPKLGISGALVIGSEAGLELGVQRVDGYPWLSGSNTYLAGHRIGFPGTGSDHIFYNLPLLGQGDGIYLQDSLGRVYEYRVSGVFAVTPYDAWVMDPVAGRDMVTLQTCTETLGDWWTIGPRLMSSGPESGRLIVRAERV